MSDEQLDDLKQFIDSRISQSETRTGQQIEDLRKEVLDGFAGVSEAIEEINKHFDERLTKLENQVA